MEICDGRVVIITGAGRGLGRAHALAFAEEGASVVVNDLGGAMDGSDPGSGPAAEVAAEIRAKGGKAIANTDDIADWDGAGRLIQAAIAEFGDVHVLVNNAGILRDRMFVSSTVEEWDAVIRVHLRGHFCPTKHAVNHWRAQVKANGRPAEARIINTSSGSGLAGSIGQSSYAAAKAGIAALTVVQAAEMGRYGITANAVAPAARTRMTEGPFAEMMKKPEDGFDVFAPENVSPLVVWLGSTASRDVTGRVFEVQGGEICVADGWQKGPTVDKGARWAPYDVGNAVANLLADAPTPQKVYGT
ncbi:MAG: NAD(P)-dependent dehydrogenase (short-subunit alcohol dehydrogenase family) [Myxococcota bacterium]|jgi:NAD(P)-dependent dehydrogenase (short-subunit alcohol dehydrogenase family)